MHDASFDNHGVAPVSDPEPRGAAALSLVESLIHFLVGRSAMTHAEAIDIIQIASDAQRETSLDRGDDIAVEPAAVSLLNAIAASLAIDMP